MSTSGFFLFRQRPEIQGYFAVKSIVQWLLYKGKNEDSRFIMPLDIIMKENLPFYRDILDY